MTANSGARRQDGSWLGARDSQKSKHSGESDSFFAPCASETSSGGRFWYTQMDTTYYGLLVTR